MVDWRVLFSSKFWFSLQWNPLHVRTAILMVGFFAVMVFVGFALLVLPARRKNIDQPLRRALARGGVACVVSGFFGLFFTFTAYEQAGLLGGRFWFLFLGLGFAAWIAWVWWRAHILVPAEREAAAVRRKLEKYLPHTKQRA